MDHVLPRAIVSSCPRRAPPVCAAAANATIRVAAAARGLPRGH